MKLKSGYLIRDIAGQTIVVPVGSEAVRFNGIISINKTGRVLWNALQSEQTLESLVHGLLETFAVDESTATADVAAFVETLKQANLLE